MPQPPERGCRLRLQLIREAICGGRERDAEYVLDWLALALQKPQQPIWNALVICGPRGVGKSTLAKILAPLFGDGFRHVRGHQVNSALALESVALLFVDDVPLSSRYEARGCSSSK